MRRPTQRMAALRLARPPTDRSRQESNHLFGNGIRAEMSGDKTWHS